MAIEGMVDALRRARRWVRPQGCVIDLHPTATVPTIDVGGQVIGFVETPDGPARHAAADAAVEDVIRQRLFVRTASSMFDFYTWADSVDELREHIEESWCDAGVVVHAAGRGRARVRERVHAAKLLVAGDLD